MSMKQQNNVGQNILPPISVLAEEIIIGQLLSDRSARKYIIENVIANFFVLQKYQVLYCYTANMGTRYSLAQLINAMWDQKLLEEIGGILHITRIINKSQAVSLYYDKYIYIEYCVKILRYHYIKRLFVQYSYSILQLNYFCSISTMQMHKKASRYLEAIYSSRKTEKKIEFRKSVSGFLRRINKFSGCHTETLSGFRDLDKITNGFKEGELVIVAGRPSMGKTSFAINIAHHGIFNLKLSVHIFSLEMSKSEILDRLIALASNISIQKIQQKAIGKYDWVSIQKACKLLMSSSLHINDQEYSSVEYIKRQYGDYLDKKKLLLIDYLQLIKCNYYSSENRSQEISIITRELKILAKSTRSPIILLSQLNRNIENRTNKRPLLSDLRESGCISRINIPHAQTSGAGHLLLEAVHCFAKQYKFNIVDQAKLALSKKQYIYCIAGYRAMTLKATHNHKILVNQAWQKTDQIKQKSYGNVKPSSASSFKLTIELNILQKIKLLEKETTYDIALHEHSNFLIHEHIIHNSIEQDSDLILMLYQDPEATSKDKIDIVIAKHRNGPVGSFRLLFHAETCKFANVESDSFDGIY